MPNKYEQYRQDRAVFRAGAHSMLSEMRDMQARYKYGWAKYTGDVDYARELHRGMIARKHDLAQIRVAGKERREDIGLRDELAEEAEERRRTAFEAGQGAWFRQQMNLPFTPSSTAEANAIVPLWRYQTDRLPEQAAATWVGKMKPKLVEYYGEHGELIQQATTPAELKEGVRLAHGFQAAALTEARERARAEQAEAKRMEDTTKFMLGFVSPSTVLVPEQRDPKNPMRVLEAAVTYGDATPEQRREFLGTYLELYRDIQSGLAEPGVAAPQAQMPPTVEKPAPLVPSEPETPAEGAAPAALAKADLGEIRKVIEDLSKRLKRTPTEDEVEAELNRVGLTGQWEVQP